MIYCVLLFPRDSVFASRFFNFSYNRYARGLDCLADDHVDCYLLGTVIYCSFVIFHVNNPIFTHLMMFSLFPHLPDDNGFIVVSEVHVSIKMNK